LANANPSRLGQINQTGDNLALFLKVFSGEVLTTFTRQAVYRPHHTIRQIPSGKQAQFPAIGITTAYTHNPGDEILGSKINMAEKNINIEGLLISPVFIPNIDEAMNHYDVRTPYAEAIALALSKQFDQDVSRTASLAARQTTPNVQGVFPGNTLTSTEINALYASDGPTLFSGIYDAGVTLDQRDVPRDGRIIVVRPLQHALLVKSEKPFDYILNDGKTGLGGYAEGIVRMIDGTGVIKTNNFYNGNDYTGWTNGAYVGTGGGVNPNEPAARQHDYSTSQAQIFHKSAMGTVELQSVTMESEYDIRRQGWLTLGKFLCGHDWLRPEAAFELQSAAPAG
jgi:hypothetical protein